jgi:ATP-dependent Clp protease ATP-binding subunit ClpA
MMFERFTRGAREAVERAQDEARAIGSPKIDTGEMLLGVAGGDGPGARVLADHGASYQALRERVAGGGLDGEALAAIGIDLDEIRRRAEDDFGPGALERRRRPRGSHVPFSGSGKKALELALREAIDRGDKEIGDEHVLLGLLREGGVERLLRAVGADPAALRAALSPAGSRRARGA